MVQGLRHTLASQAFTFCQDTVKRTFLVLGVSVVPVSIESQCVWAFRKCLEQCRAFVAS